MKALSVRQPPPAFPFAIRLPPLPPLILPPLPPRAALAMLCLHVPCCAMMCRDVAHLPINRVRRA